MRSSRDMTIRDKITAGDRTARAADARADRSTAGQETRRELVPPAQQHGRDAERQARIFSRGARVSGERHAPPGPDGGGATETSRLVQTAIPVDALRRPTPRDSGAAPTRCDDRCCGFPTTVPPPAARPGRSSAAARTTHVVGHELFVPSVRRRQTFRCRSNRADRAPFSAGLTSCQVSCSRPLQRQSPHPGRSPLPEPGTIRLGTRRASGLRRRRSHPDC